MGVQLPRLYTYDGTFNPGGKGRSSTPSQQSRKKAKERTRAPLIIAIASTSTGRVQYPEVPPGSTDPTPGYWRPHRSASITEISQFTLRTEGGGVWKLTCGDRDRVEASALKVAFLLTFLAL
jgi:hypothetical protein